LRLIENTAPENIPVYNSAVAPKIERKRNFLSLDRESRGNPMEGPVRGSLYPLLPTLSLQIGSEIRARGVYRLLLLSSKQKIAV